MDLEGATTCQSLLLREHQGPRAILNATERLVNSYGSECARIRQDLAIAEQQLRDYQGRLGQPFVHDTILSELTTLRDWLKACLSNTNHDPGTDTRDTASDLAERIKELKAATTAETLSDRAGQPRSTAEEPVTARTFTHSPSPQPAQDLSLAGLRNAFSAPLTRAPTCLIAASGTFVNGV